MTRPDGVRAVAAAALIAALAVRRPRQPRVRGAAGAGRQPHLQPGARPGAGGLPPRRGRRSQRPRRLSRPGLVAVAQHHVPPRQHDGGRLSRAAQQAEHQPAAQPAGRRGQRVQGRIDKATALARQRIASNPKDADAHHQLGAAVGLRASYTATVEGSVLGAFRAAREAYEEEEKTLELAATAQGRRPHRRHLPLHRRRAVDAAAHGRLRRRLRRRQGEGHVADRGSGGLRRREPDRGALRADPALQPREALRRCPEGAGDAAGTVSAQPAGVAGVGIDVAARRPGGGGRAVPDRRARALCRRHAAADVRRGRAVALQARRGIRGAGPERGRGGTSARAGRRRTQVGPRRAAISSSASWR